MTRRAPRRRPRPPARCHVPIAAVAVCACGAGGTGGGRPSDTPVDPCALPAQAPRAVGNIRDTSAELSGLAASRTVDGILWTHGDSGNAAVIYAIEETTGALRGTLQVSGATAIDWEDIAAGPCAAGQCIFVADTGDNALARANVAIYEIAEPATADTATVTALRHDITYPDGPHNVEALVVDPRDGARFAITKVQGARAQLFGYPSASGQATLLGVLPMFPADDRVTGADLFVDECGARLLVRTRGGLFAFTGTSDATVAALVATPAIPMVVATEPQGEAVAWRRDGRAYFTVSEGPNPPLSIVER